jgi:hypothetical protein
MPNGLRNKDLELWDNYPSFGIVSTFPQYAFLQQLNIALSTSRKRNYTVPQVACTFCSGDGAKVAVNADH